MNTEKLIAKAKALFELPHGRCKHFTFIMKRNKIVSVGWNNMMKTHPLAKKMGYVYPTIHSELSAVIRYQKDLIGTDIVNVRLDKKKNIQCSKPCKFCFYMLINLGVNNIYYTEYGQFFKISRLEHKLYESNKIYY